MKLLFLFHFPIFPPLECEIWLILVYCYCSYKFSFFTYEFSKMFYGRLKIFCINKHFISAEGPFDFFWSTCHLLPLHCWLRSQGNIGQNRGKWIALLHFKSLQENLVLASRYNVKCCLLVMSLIKASVFSFHFDLVQVFLFWNRALSLYSGWLQTPGLQQPSCCSLLISWEMVAVK